MQISYNFKEASDGWKINIHLIYTVYDYLNLRYTHRD